MKLSAEINVSMGLAYKERPVEAVKELTTSRVNITMAEPMPLEATE